MGFSFHRSVKMGPFRLNFSTRGVGVSAGVRGARLSVGPRGTYVSLGRGGFQYRARLDGNPRHTHAPLFDVPAPAVGGALEGNIVTASAEQLAAVSSDESLAEIQRRTSRTRWLWPYVVASSILVLLLLRASPFVAFLPCTFLALIGGVAISAWDRERTIARLFYDVSDSEIAERIAMCSGVGAWLGRTGALWHVYYAEATSDRKHHAGASTLIRRTLTSCVPRSLDRIQVNLQPWCVPVGPQQLLLLPDRLLVLQAQQRVAGLPYDQLQLHYESSRFIEDRPSTTDAEFIEWTWQYVNKSGGPDRRFRDNRQLPVYRYGELHLVSQSGVHIVLQCSSRACAEGAAHALEALIDRARQSLRAPSYRQQ